MKDDNKIYVVHYEIIDFYIEEAGVLRAFKSRVDAENYEKRLQRLVSRKLPFYRLEVKYKLKDSYCRSFTNKVSNRLKNLLTTVTELKLNF